MVESIIILSIICGTLIELVYLVIKYKNTCKHKWEKVDEEKVWNRNHVITGPDDQHYEHRYVIMQCTKCGNIKTVKIA